jgi:hypothetical protein
MYGITISIERGVSKELLSEQSGHPRGRQFGSVQYKKCASVLFNRPNMPPSLTATRLSCGNWLRSLRFNMLPFMRSIENI